MRLLLICVAGTSILLSQHLDTSAWTAMGEGGTARVTSNVLTFSYELGRNGFSAAVLPAAGGLTGMERASFRLKFRVKADHDTALAVSLSEKKPGGGDYSAVFWAPANIWQTVELTAGDFSANDGPNDPTDSDGKLDLDQVMGIAIVDLAQLFARAADNPNFPIAVARPSGAHTLLVDDFHVLSEAPARHALAENTTEIDHFDRGYLQWITLGAMTLKLTTAESPLGQPSLQASYEQTDGPYAILLRRLASLDLSKVTRLSFDIASERESTLVVSLELKKQGSSQGPRYNLTIFPPGEKKIFHVNVRLAAFELDANSPAPGPEKLNPALLKSLALTDITVPSGGEGGPNTIWIGNVDAK